MTDSEWTCECEYEKDDIDPVGKVSKWRCFAPDGTKGKEIDIVGASFTEQKANLPLVEQSGNFVKIETSSAINWDDHGTFGPINAGDKLKYSLQNGTCHLNGTRVYPVK